LVPDSLVEEVGAFALVAVLPATASAFDAVFTAEDTETLASPGKNEFVWWPHSSFAEMRWLPK
jgi:hypothetical protein